MFFGGSVIEPGDVHQAENIHYHPAGGSGRFQHFVAAKVKGVDKRHPFNFSPAASAISLRRRSSSSSCTGSLRLMVSRSLLQSAQFTALAGGHRVRRTSEFCSERTTLMLARHPLE